MRQREPGGKEGYAGRENIGRSPQPLREAQKSRQTKLFCRIKCNFALRSHRLETPIYGNKRSNPPTTNIPQRRAPVPPASYRPPVCRGKQVHVGFSDAPGLSARGSKRGQCARHAAHQCVEETVSPGGEAQPRQAADTRSLPQEQTHPARYGRGKRPPSHHGHPPPKWKNALSTSSSDWPNVCNPHSGRL